MFSTPSMTYRVLLIVPIYLPNWLLVLPPKNGFNTCSESIPVFGSISTDLNRSSRFKIMVNSNLKLLQLRFMIPAVAHTWCDYGQNHLTLNTFDFPELFPLDFFDGLQNYRSLTIWTPWLNYKSWTVLLLRLSNGFSKKSAVYPHNYGYPVRILWLSI
jgi:hypothetical protein